MSDSDTLPPVITAYLAAQLARDADAALALLTGDAEIGDEGRTYTGHEQIRSWITTAASEYTYTTELTGTERIDDEHWVAIHHLAGDFPGGVADLRYVFTLRDGRIARLHIAP